MFDTKSTATIHPVAQMYADEFKAGKLDRREFLARSTALGVAATSAYALGGIARPAGSIHVHHCGCVLGGTGEQTEHNEQPE